MKRASFNRTLSKFLAFIMVAGLFLSPPAQAAGNEQMPEFQKINVILNNWRDDPDIASLITAINDTLKEKGFGDNQIDVLTTDGIKVEGITPSWEPPSWEPPSWEPPSWEPPSWEPPSWEPPSWEPPSWEPPSWEPPSWEPPSWEPPSWEPPSWEPPSWEPPSWEPPSFEPVEVKLPVADMSSWVVADHYDSGYWYRRGTEGNATTNNSNSNINSSGSTAYNGNNFTSLIYNPGVSANNSFWRNLSGSVTTPGHPHNYNWKQTFTRNAFANEAVGPGPVKLEASGKQFYGLYSDTLEDGDIIANRSLRPFFLHAQKVSTADNVADSSANTSYLSATGGTSGTGTHSTQWTTFQLPRMTLEQWVNRTPQLTGGHTTAGAATLGAFDRHILVQDEKVGEDDEGNDITKPKMDFVGYANSRYIDFAYYPPDIDPNMKKFYFEDIGGSKIPNYNNDPEYGDEEFCYADLTGADKLVKFNVFGGAVNTHTLFGAGFLVNAGINRQGIISGYYVAYVYPDSGTDHFAPGTFPPTSIVLLKIRDGVTAENFHRHMGTSSATGDGAFNTTGIGASNIGTGPIIYNNAAVTNATQRNNNNNSAIFDEPLAIIDLDNYTTDLEDRNYSSSRTTASRKTSSKWWQDMYINIAISPTSLKVYQADLGDKGNIDYDQETKLPIGMTEVLSQTLAPMPFNGFGPAVSYRSHGCNRATQFTFSELEMEIIGGFEPPVPPPPSFEPPSFEPPSFEPPSFEPPSFEPPSWEPPTPMPPKELLIDALEQANTLADEDDPASKQLKKEHTNYLIDLTDGDISDRITQGGTDDTMRAVGFIRDNNTEYNIFYITDTDNYLLNDGQPGGADAYDLLGDQGKTVRAEGTNPGYPNKPEAPDRTDFTGDGEEDPYGEKAYSQAVKDYEEALENYYQTEEWESYQKFMYPIWYAIAKYIVDRIPNCDNGINYYSDDVMAYGNGNDGAVLGSYVLDEDGNPVVDVVQTPIMVQDVDVDGNPAVDANGDPIMVQKTDANGDPVFDEIKTYRTDQTSIHVDVSGLTHAESQQKLNSSSLGFDINLTKELLYIPEGFVIRSYSTDGGVKWKDIKPAILDLENDKNPFNGRTSKGKNNFSKFLNKDMNLVISDSPVWKMPALTDKTEAKAYKAANSAIAKQKKPLATDLDGRWIGPANTVTFPKIYKRAKPTVKFAINYAVYADITGRTPGDWTLAPASLTKQKTISAEGESFPNTAIAFASMTVGQKRAQVDSVLNDLHIAVADVSESTGKALKVPDSRGWGYFCHDDGIPVKPTLGAKPVKTIYYAKLKARVNLDKDSGEFDGTFTSPGKQKKITALSELKKPAFKLAVKAAKGGKAEVKSVKLKTGDIIFTGDTPPNDSNSPSIGGTKSWQIGRTIWLYDFKDSNGLVSAKIPQSKTGGLTDPLTEPGVIWRMSDAKSAGKGVISFVPLPDDPAGPLTGNITLWKEATAKKPASLRATLDLGGGVAP